MWNRELFRAVITKIVKDNGSFAGKKVKSRVDLYEILSEILYVAPETIKGWSRHNSKGPGDDKVLSKLESLLGVELTTAKIEEVSKMNNCNTKYSDFVKENIKNCYKLVIDYIRALDLEEEETFLKMTMELGDYECFVPEEVYKEIIDFVEQKLEPIVYDGDEYFSDCYSPEIGEFEGETFKIKDDMVNKFVAVYYVKVAELDMAFQKLGKEKIYPVIMR